MPGDPCLQERRTPGRRGNLDLVEDRIVFRESPLRRHQIEAVRPFNQAKSDAKNPIRVVEGPGRLRYVMQGNHRVYGAQEDGLTQVEVLLYTEDEWEELMGLPFVPGEGTEDPEVEL